VVPYSFFEFSLCLSRACLGKMFAFIYKLLKKTRGRYRWSMAQRVPSATRHRRCARTPSNRPFLTPQILPRQALYLVALGGFGSETRWFAKTSFAGSTFAKTSSAGSTGAPHAHWLALQRLPQRSSNAQIRPGLAAPGGANAHARNSHHVFEFGNFIVCQDRLRILRISLYVASGM
jgi:hypothetical protein